LIIGEKEFDWMNEITMFIILLFIAALIFSIVLSMNIPCPDCNLTNNTTSMILNTTNVSIGIKFIK
jgi:hypothetical protein